MTDDPVLRAARLAEIRRQIAARAYETPERLEAALDAFLDRHAPRPRSADRPHSPSDPSAS